MTRLTFLATLYFLLTFASKAAGREDGGRLETAVLPRSATIELDLDPNQPTYHGVVTYDLEVQKPTPSFTFHAVDLTIESATLLKKHASIATRLNPDTAGRMRVTTEKLLEPGRYTFRMSFKNEFSTKAVSLYRVLTNNLGYLFTQFEANYAREAFPCWDEPQFKIPFTVSLIVPAGQTAISNSPIERQEDIKDHVKYHFQKTPPIPSYLLALAVGPFDSIPIPGLTIPGKIYTVKGRSQEARIAAEATAPILRTLEAYFDMPYPYAKLDLIAAPEFMFGAMENPGAIVFSERRLFVDPASKRSEVYELMYATMAHEFAHMWFGDFVTMKWWDDLWLNEAFANWLAAKVVKMNIRDSNTEWFLVDSMNRALLTDMSPLARSIRQEVGAEDNPLQFVMVSYNKGMSVLSMFESWIGEDKFREGIRHYLKKHAWSNAVGADLWSTLSQTSNTDMMSSMASFLNQAGAPLISIEPLTGSSIRIRQTPLTPNGQKLHQQQIWEVPIVLRYSDGITIQTQRIMLKESSQILDLKLSGKLAWVHPNSAEHGYYRWKIPDPMLNNLMSNQLSRLDFREQMALPQVMHSLLVSGDLTGAQYLKALEQLSGSRNTVVLSLVLDAIEEVYVDFIRNGSGAEEAFSAYVTAPLWTIQQQLSQDAASPKQAELEGQLLIARSTMARDTAAVNRARDLARTYLDSTQQIDPAVARASLAVAARNGDAALFDEVTRTFEQATDLERRNMLLGTLGEFVRPELILRALAYSLEGPLRPHELMEIPRRIAEQPTAQAALIDFMERHFSEIRQRVAPQFLAFLPWLFVNVSEADLARASRLFDAAAADIPGIEKSLAEVKEIHALRLQLLAAVLPSMRLYLTAPSSAEIAH